MLLVGGTGRSGLGAAGLCSPRPILAPAAKTVCPPNGEGGGNQGLRDLHNCQPSPRWVLQPQSKRPPRSSLDPAPVRLQRRSRAPLGAAWGAPGPPTARGGGGTKWLHPTAFPGLSPFPGAVGHWGDKGEVAGESGGQTLCPPGRAGWAHTVGICPGVCVPAAAGVCPICHPLRTHVPPGVTHVSRGGDGLCTFPNGFANEVFACPGPYLGKPVNGPP